MFVRYFLEIPLAFERVERALLEAPEAWLPGVAQRAEDVAAALETGAVLAANLALPPR